MSADDVRRKVGIGARPGGTDWPWTPGHWFSRRHETADANREARERYQSRSGRAARIRRAKEREA